MRVIFEELASGGGDIILRYTKDGEEVVHYARVKAALHDAVVFVSPNDAGLETSYVIPLSHISGMQCVESHDPTITTAIVSTWEVRIEL